VGWALDQEKERAPIEAEGVADADGALRHDGAGGIFKLAPPDVEDVDLSCAGFTELELTP
jgi:hypothetical protein